MPFALLLVLKAQPIAKRIGEQKSRHQYTHFSQIELVYMLVLK